MKTIEEKAKAYDEAISRAKVKIAGVDRKDRVYYVNDIEEIFPELKESEDERIRKAIVNVFASHKDYEVFFGASVEDILAWLEKLGKQKLTDKVERKFKIGDEIKTKNEESLIITRIDRWGYWSEDLFICNFDDTDKWELVEQKPADVEPKFKVGNKIYLKPEYRMPDDDTPIANTVFEIKAIDDKHYRFDSSYIFIEDQDKYELVEQKPAWTIEDAKAGDVLADGNFPFIFKKIDTNRYSYAYCGISANNDFKVKADGKSDEWTWMQDIKPATKEQRDTLLKAMTEAGYTFDFEKNELKKVEQKTWSEEDERNIKEVLYLVEANYLSSEEPHDRLINFLESLKDRHTWEPSDEQMDALASALSLAKNCGEESAFDLRTLYEQLKKLKG